MKQGLLHLSVQHFGLIKDIFVIDSSFVAFEYQRYETLSLSPELPTYEVTVPNVAQATELAVNFKDNTFVPIKYSLCDITAHRH